MCKAIKKEKTVIFTFKISRDFTNSCLCGNMETQNVALFGKITLPTHFNYRIFTLYKIFPHNTKLSKQTNS